MPELGTGAKPLGARLQQNETTLLAAYRAIAKAVTEGRPITPAAEWLVDNYHLVEDQIREIRLDLPPGYYRQLPKLADGPLKGLPRVFGLAWTFIAHTDSRFDADVLCSFVNAYQRVQPLTIGELWAVAITLRIMLVENLRRASHRILSSRQQRENADNLADRLLAAKRPQAAEIDALLRPHENTPMPPAFAAQLVQRLRDQDPALTPAMQWLEAKLNAQDTSTDIVVQSEHMRQASMTVTVRNIISSMRRVSAVDWAELFETISPVDEMLRGAIGYSRMDFATRNQYRRAIEELARGSKLNELEVTARALAETTAAARHAKHVNETEKSRTCDPGFYLIAAGRPAFERAIGFHPPVNAWLGRATAAAGFLGYIVSIGVVAAALIGLTLSLIDAGLLGWWWPALAILGLFPATDAAVALVNRFATSQFAATTLPGLELRDGISADLRTMVVVPTLLTSLQSVAEQVEGLEVHYLASQDGDIHFALLSDWTDATAQQAEGDGELLAAAAGGIARLNDRYGNHFLLLHRRRVWNPIQKLWMGWERKRGKLHELNRLLRGATDTTFMGLDHIRVPTGVRYVITLDADTRLPRDAARRLVGKMAHPLNRPRFDARTGRVAEGYAVLQPRITATLPTGKEQSVFQKIFSTSGGIDPYAAAVSDVYQDLFGEGSYAGKGIYDVDLFEAALADRVPENTLLSHDLFEGIFARAGLVSDIELFETFPSRYDVAASRLHRWARGDWQLLPWIFGRGAPGNDQDQTDIPLGGLWKMLDNLRRSLSTPASVLALAIGWTLPLQLSLIWTGFILATIALPSLLPVFAALRLPRPGISPRSHVQALAGDMWLAMSQIAFAITFLAHQAALMIDAIARTLNRLFFTRRRLLEWVTAAQATYRPELDLVSAYNQMAGAVAIAVGTLALSLAFGTYASFIALPFVALWGLSPLIARWSSASPTTVERAAVTAQDAGTLRLIARRTWRYFETFVTADDNSLPPDNFQEDPEPIVAHRTSPTNIGLYLLSVVAARDNHWIGTVEMIERLEATLATLNRLDLYRGHLLNWYDTRTLLPLEPKYVSSVDSGNLAGHLIAVANACSEQAANPGVDADWRLGVADALAVVLETLTTIKQSGSHVDGIRHHIAEFSASLETAGTLEQAHALAARLVGLADALRSERDDARTREILAWSMAAERAVASHAQDSAPAADVAARLGKLALAANHLSNAMDFRFLVNPELKLLSIGYVVGTETLDPSCYDLLASEARLASFVAIAKGDAPVRHWFRLGRLVTAIDRGAALISWSGSMFEYLMPSLVMRAPKGSLLASSNRLIVSRQIAHGRKLGLPWGISESAYNARDLEFTYQYSNFGVPGLGLKRGLSENAVVAPYATALAAMVDPAAACKNFSRLSDIGARGAYGFYEAVDFTPSRIPEGQRRAVVRAYMAHHQGMTIVAIANVLGDGRMRTRFHSEPRIRATELLLQERMPRDVALAHPRAEEVQAAPKLIDDAAPRSRVVLSPHSTPPQTQLLSNGRYSVMMSAAGGGYSRWNNLAITRWRGDATSDGFGTHIYLRDARTSAVWSAGYQPTGAEPDDYKVAFADGRAEFVRHDGTLTTALEVMVSPECDGEVRRVTISNHGARMREIEVTYYAELVLAPATADWAHPAFSKLFVETDYIAAKGLLLATRRQGFTRDKAVWASMHSLVEGDGLGALQVETDRARFIGRGRSLRDPAAISDQRPLSNTVGAVLDPVFASRRRVRIRPGGSVQITYWTLISGSRDEAIALADRHRDASAYDRVTTMAWSQGQIERHHMGITSDQANQYQRLASHLLYANPALRAPSETIARGAQPPNALWTHGISGDLPVILVRIDDEQGLPFVRDLLLAHEYWQRKRLDVDLVILNEKSTSYVQDLQASLEALVRAGEARRRHTGDALRGSVFMLRRDLITPEGRNALFAVSRVDLADRRGTLSEQLDRLAEPASAGAPHRSRSTQQNSLEPSPQSTRPPDLEYFNGIGGFASNGREYVVALTDGLNTPAPWLNVIANPQFGFQVSADGGGYTWSESSRENQLTDWSNDPVCDRTPEVIYIRDDDTGELWTPTPSPIRRTSTSYLVRHGQGYSRFEHTAGGIACYMLQYVAKDDPIKISRLSVHNTTRRTRRLTLTGYVEWLLGPPRGLTTPIIVTSSDPTTRAIFARNPWSGYFGSQVAFADMAGHQTSWTADRTEFLGRNGSPAQPAALLTKSRLSGTVGAGLDPCAALQRSIELKPGESIEVALFLGAARNEDEARTLIGKYRTADLNRTLDEVTDFWNEVLDKVQVKTPDRSMDIMINRWLLHQTLVCRLWARSAFYQSGGAYGFRDQLQDAMAMTLTMPELTRAHLLRAAARQFVEGDVQHWWLAHSGQGVRTGFSDDRLWLGYATAHYLLATADHSVLDEKVPFLQGPVLQDGETDAFFEPGVTDEKASLFEHCARAIDLSLAVGSHGLPLIGTGDWNDGFSRVGVAGKGESVWLGWFLCSVLGSFIPIAQQRGEAARAERWLLHRELLREALEREGWDGDWYRRAYFDDGTPLGSGTNQACRIDSIAQSWAVLSGAADADRARRAMAAVDTLLVDRQNGLAPLFNPPFDKAPVDPGYVKDYPPGVRENGGQYTHAAAWSVMAFAALGQGDKAAGLFWLLNPINRARTFTDSQRYRVEPYVVAADVYTVPPHVGRGGWTWYTGAAGWLYRAGLESILGLKVEGDTLRIEPCIPTTWPGYEIRFKHRSATYDIVVENPNRVTSSVAEVRVDGIKRADNNRRIKLEDDGANHKILVVLG
ncbi:MAG: GH36-type glycosyl hydrolase domain-containing protein [Micropepsaceae bacterium]